MSMSGPCWKRLCTEDNAASGGCGEPHTEAAFRSHRVLLGAFGGSIPSPDATQWEYRDGSFLHGVVAGDPDGQTATYSCEHQGGE